MRVEAAQQIVGLRDGSCKEIADACGFQTPLTMRRTFLRVLGITAGEYANCALSGHLTNPKWIDEANAGYLITSCVLVAREEARHVVRHSYDFTMSFLYPEESIAPIIGG